MPSSPVRTTADRSQRGEPASTATQAPGAGGPVAGPLRVDGAFGRFADRLLVLELPDLPDDRRITTVAFVCRRADQVPTPLRLGVVGLVAGTDVSTRLVGHARTVGFLQSTSLPFVAELARMVRSLGFAFIWETWPDTSPTGRPG